MSPLFQNTPLKGFRERGITGPQPGAAARRAPRHRAFAQMRVPEQSHPDSPTNFASCPPATAWGKKPHGCHRHATHSEDLAGVPTPGWKDAVDGTSRFGGWCEGARGALTLTRAHTRAHAHARRGPLAVAPILRQGREAVTRATSAAVTSPEHHAGPGLRRARARLLRVASCGDRARRLRRHFIPSRSAAGAARWVGTRGEAAPGAHVCPAPGEERGTARRPATRSSRPYPAAAWGLSWGSEPN